MHCVSIIQSPIVVQHLNLENFPANGIITRKMIAGLPHGSDLLDVHIQDLPLQGVYSQFVHGHGCKWSRLDGKRQKFGQWLVDGVLKGDLQLDLSITIAMARRRPKFILPSNG